MRNSIIYVVDIAYHSPQVKKIPVTWSGINHYIPSLIDLTSYAAWKCAKVYLNKAPEPVGLHI